MISAASGTATTSCVPTYVSHERLDTGYLPIDLLQESGDACDHGEGHESEGPEAASAGSAGSQRRRAQQDAVREPGEGVRDRRRLARVQLPCRCAAGHAHGHHAR